jgi:hypothetical protein
VLLPERAPPIMRVRLLPTAHSPRPGDSTAETIETPACMTKRAGNYIDFGR